MSELDLMKLFESYEEEIDTADFTPQELSELLEKLRQDKKDGAPLPLTKEEFKKRYFDYYDDVKDKSLKKQDW